MVGSAVAMMVWFSAARNAASVGPKNILRTSAWRQGTARRLRCRLGGGGGRCVLHRARAAKPAPATDAQLERGPAPEAGSGKIHDAGPAQCRKTAQFEGPCCKATSRRGGPKSTPARCVRYAACFGRGPRSGRSSMATTATNPAPGTPRRRRTPRNTARNRPAALRRRRAACRVSGRARRCRCRRARSLAKRRNDMRSRVGGRSSARRW